MPTDAWEAANGSSSEEEEESDEEVVVTSRQARGGMFRVANADTTTNTAQAAATPQEAKSAVLSQIKGMASERQVNEEVVAAPVSTEKSDAEKQALEARQQLIAAQNAAKAAQAAAIQQAAMQAAQNQAQQASKQAAEMEAEMRAKQAQAEEEAELRAKEAQAQAEEEAELRAKEAQAQAQAEAEKKKAEERVAAQRAAQQEALSKAQEAARKAQADALAKAQVAKQEAEARAKAQQAQQQKPAAPAVPSQQQQTLQQAQLQQQQRAQAEAQARAAQAKAQAEAQARAMQAKAQAEAEAKARAAAAQAQQQRAAPASAKPAAAPAAPAQKPAAPAAPKPAAPAAAPKAAAPAAAPKPTAPAAKTAVAAPAAAANGAAKTGVAVAAPQNVQQQQQQQANAVPQVGISLQRMGQEISRPHVQTTRTSIPPPQQQQQQPAAAKPAAQTTPAQPMAPTMKPQVTMTRGNIGFDAHAAANATPVPVGHTQLKTPGKVVVPQLQQHEVAAAPAEKPGNTALKQTAKITEEVLGNEQIRTVSNTSANRPTMRADGVASRFVEQQNTPAPLQSVSRGSTLEGAKRWEEERAREAEASTMGQGETPAAVRLNDDTCWQTQRRVAAEVAAPQIGRIVIPELKETHETQPTVIVRKPAGYEKVKWNEFPEEIQPERQSVPRTKAQEWVPVNNEVTEITRTGFASGRVNNAWPPTAEEAQKEAGQVNRIRTNDDLAWIQQEQHEVIKSVPRTSRISRVWPPQEDEKIQQEFQTSHMPVVQWPPPEFEQMEQEKIEVLAKHIPTKKHERQWPPPPPQYYIPGDEESSMTVQSAGPTTTTTTTTTTTRVVRAM